MPFHWHAEILFAGIVTSSLPGGMKTKVLAGGGWKHLAEMISALHVSGFLLDTPGLVSAAVPSRGDQH